MENKEIALTQTVQKGGCAAKVSATELRKILSQVEFPKAHKELLVDGGLFDDAAIYKVSDEVALVQTLDFFTPILDTPRLFGAVAATNALSDVYAMGGKPKTAMAILAFPLATFDSSIIVEVMQGASDKIAEAGANLVGGHSIDDDTLKFGLSVTGFISPQKVWSNSGARPGDKLILTKALGTGTLTAALKGREFSEKDISDAILSMSTLNNVVDVLAADHEIHAATDITGFGLSGHSMQMAQASKVSLKFQMAQIPALDKALYCLKEEWLTKAHRSNRQYTEGKVTYLGVDPLLELLTHDPQTSGGLLLAVPGGQSESILKTIQKSFPRSSIVGSVEEKSEHWVTFEG